MVQNQNITESPTLAPTYSPTFSPEVDFQSGLEDVVEVFYDLLEDAEILVEENLEIATGIASFFVLFVLCCCYCCCCRSRKGKKKLRRRAVSAEDVESVSTTSGEVRPMGLDLPPEEEYKHSNFRNISEDEQKLDSTLGRWWKKKQKLSSNKKVARPSMDLADHSNKSLGLHKWDFDEDEEDSKSSSQKKSSLFSRLSGKRSGGQDTMPSPRLGRSERSRRKVDLRARKSSKASFRSNRRRQSSMVSVDLPELVTEKH